MPPLYDDIVDALALTQDGAQHTVSVDNTGSTQETGEDPYGPGIWMKIDLSSAPAVSLAVAIEKTAGDASFNPYIDVYKVTNAAFDPSAPDWGMIGFTTAHLGEGGTSDTKTWALIGGTGSSTGNRSQTGIFYLHYQDWDGLYEGVSDFTYALPYCLRAEDVVNLDSPSASVVSGRVREQFDEVWDVNFTAEIQRDPALTWTWAGPSGVFQVSAKGRFDGTGTLGSLGGARVLVVVNGRPFTAVTPIGNVSTYNTDFQWMQYDGLSGAGNTYDEDGRQAPFVVIQAGDTVEVFVISTKRTGASVWKPLDLENICFVPLVEALSSTYCTPSFAFPTDPLGDVWGSPNGWGGQQFVPDEVWTILGVTPYDEGDTARGFSVADFDMVALADGTVYVISRDSINDGGTIKGFVAVKKYDTGTETWSQIATLNVNDPDLGHRVEAVSCEYDGTYVYFTWWEADDPGDPGPSNHAQFMWHCVRLDPSDDSTTELGTGQNVYGVVTSSYNYPYTDILACGIVCEGDGGDVFVSAIESEDDGLSEWRMIVWRWNGSTWADTSLPDPSVTSAGWSISGSVNIWDVLGPMVMAHQDGPTTTGLTLVYAYDESTNTRLVTIEYEVGSGWSNEILSDVVAVEGDARLYGVSAPTAYSATPVNLTPLWSETEGRLLLALDTVAASGDGIWDVWQMNDGGTQWEPLNDRGPGDMAGGWTASRGWAAIGPDGEVFRAMSIATKGEADFEPKIAKTCVGYGAGFAIATTAACGDTTPTTWWPQIGDASNYRLRIVGQTAYVIVNLLVEEYDPDTDTYTGDTGEGVFVFRLLYDPCSVFVPHIYRLVFDS